MANEAQQIVAADKPAPELHKARRERLARRLAIGAVAVHLLAGLLVVLWVFVVVPAFVALAVGMVHVGQIRRGPQSVLVASNIHEICKQFWYVLLVLAVALSVVDYLVVVWLTKWLGFKWGASFVIAIFLGIILNLYLTHSLLLQQPIQQAIDEMSQSRPA